MQKDTCPKCGAEMDMKEEDKYEGQKWVYVEFCATCGFEKN